MQVGVYAATYVVCLASGFLPFVSAELYLASAAAMSDGTRVFPLVVAGTLGQMTAKTVIFLAGRGLRQLPVARDSERMRKALAKAQTWRGRIDLFVFVSAWAGIPPFYVVSLLGGALSLGVARFAAVGFAGRLIRFLVIAAGAHAGAW